MKNLEKMTNAELVKVYNGLGPAKPIKNWKGKKSLLIEKINTAQKQKAPVGGKKKTRTGEIRAACETLLQDVAYHENKDKPVGPDNQRKTAGKNTRPVGFSFAEILDTVKQQFPDANTSYACLRWYAVHLRHAGHVLPRRPKSSWK